MRLVKHTTVYLPDGDDFIEDSASTEGFDCEGYYDKAVLCAVEYLRKSGAIEPSCIPWGGNAARVWFTCETYVHPYTGAREESSVHFGEGWDIDAQVEVLRLMFPQWEHAL